MEINVNTKYEVGNVVVVTNEFEGTIVGIKVTIARAPGSVSEKLLIVNKSYMVEIGNDVDEFDEDVIKLKEEDV